MPAGPGTAPRLQCLVKDCSGCDVTHKDTMYLKITRQAKCHADSQRCCKHQHADCHSRVSNLGAAAAAKQSQQAFIYAVMDIWPTVPYFRWELPGLSFLRVKRCACDLSVTKPPNCPRRCPWWVTGLSQVMGPLCPGESLRDRLLAPPYRTQRSCPATETTRRDRECHRRVASGYR